MSVKVHINLSQGILEVEGDSEFVQSIYRDFKLELIKLSSQNKLPASNIPQFSSVAQGEFVNIEEQEDVKQEPVKSRKKPRKSATQPPKGHSCADRIMTLRKKGFFKAQKTPSEIVQGLAKEGWTHKNNQVSAAVGVMFNRGDMQRTSAAHGFVYFWDRD